MIKIIPKKVFFMKKVLIAFLSAFLALFGFSACSNDSDDNSALILAAVSSGKTQFSFGKENCYGFYWGTWTVMGTEYPMCVEAKADSFRWIAQGYGDTTYPNEYTVWLLNEDGSVTVKGYSASSSKTAAERKAADDPSAVVNFTKENNAVKGAFNVPSMKKNMKVSDAVLSAGSAYDNRYDGAAGAIAKTYKGTWNAVISYGTGISATTSVKELVMTRVSDDTVKIAIPDFSGDMQGTTMNVPGFDLELAVSAVSSGRTKTYTVTLPDNATEYTVKKTVNGVEKTFAGSAFSCTMGTTVTVNTTYKYGSMPFPFVVSFTTAAE